MGQKVISKWGRESYMKMGKLLFQSVRITSKQSKIDLKVRQLLKNGVKRYFKVWQLFQSGTII